MARRTDEPAETVAADEAAPVEDVVIEEPNAGAIEAADDGQSTEGRLSAPAGSAYLTYVGHADSMTFGDLVLQPGIPTLVSKEEAEGILTHPFEDVVVSDSIAAPPPPEE